MPVELLHRPQPADENQRAVRVPAQPVAPASDPDDWSGVLCCSAMRPRDSAEGRAPGAEWHPGDAAWGDD